MSAETTPAPPSEAGPTKPDADDIDGVWKAMARCRESTVYAGGSGGLHKILARLAWLERAAEGREGAT